MRRLKNWAVLAAFGLTAATTQFAQANDVEVPQNDTMTVQPVGFWLHDDGCDSCDDCCVDSCDGCGCGLGGGLLGGLVKQTDPCFNDFISPMINFVYFEDPRNVSEIRPIYVHHSVPDRIGVGGVVPAGGDIQLLALQFRAKLTENLSLIAVKDGYIMDNTGGALNGLLNDGWADVAAGLKYTFLKDQCSGTLAAAGFTYEMPSGSRSALQGIGDGQLHLFATAGKRLLDGDAHFLSSLGWKIPIDGDLQNEAIHWSNHIDFRLTDNLYAFTEIAWWHFIDDPDLGAPVSIAGQDLFNLPFAGVEGKNLVTQSVGVKVKPTDNTEVGLAYEFPISSFEDVIDDRIMIDLIIRY